LSDSTPLDEHAAFGEPGNRPVQDRDGGRGGLVVVALGVGQTCVVVDHDVHEAGSEFGLVVGVADAGAVAGGYPVLFAGLLAEVGGRCRLGAGSVLVSGALAKRPPGGRSGCLRAIHYGPDRQLFPASGVVSEPGRP
jgi:hypothetical protein